MIYIVHHTADCDGYASGAIVKIAAEEMNSKTMLIGYDYGQPFPWHLIQPNKAVVMIDVSLPMDDMLKLAKHSSMQLTWIDHHISAINDYKAKCEELGVNFCNAVLNDEIAACEIAWQHYFPTRPLPTAIELLGMYDTWRNEQTNYWQTDILPFQYGMRMHCTSPETFPYNILKDNDFVRDVIKEGAAILKYQANIDQSAMKSSFVITWNGYQCLCVNKSGMNSIAFKSIYDESIHDIIMPFFFNGKFWTFSLYTTKEINCSILAQSMGGGGHIRASGFQVDDYRVVTGGSRLPDGVPLLLMDMQNYLSFPSVRKSDSVVIDLKERIEKTLY